MIIPAGWSEVDRVIARGDLNDYCQRMRYTAR